ncbi:alpha-L-fucosidase [Paenibacillus rhizosphaerae]|uniref:alpha-L-fucosidase n=1 Tax=Paenibacillus rhizosphaerae TaxID=297318 RepID=A0A839TIK5_9BACL|nr:alpha-L-fucosidase [Paenibacillus rhizosphaerae]MBB3126646.1 alpha-L-fucosidase [Paenibacillus rhizosphaerae]
MKRQAEQTAAGSTTENLLDDPYQIEEASERQTFAERNHRMEWWREARLGLFIHWGPYAMPAGEWKGEEIQASYSEHIMLRAKIPAAEYEEMAAGWNPSSFDALKWVRTAKRAGLKYIIFTAKHHDGFAMYSSQVSDYSIVQHAAFGRDPLRELAEACEQEEMELGIYYSHAMDWHDPDSQGNTWDYPGNIGAYDGVESWAHDPDKRSRFERYLDSKSLPQVRELLTDYGKVGLMWFDCGGKLTREQGQQFLDTVYSLQPDCLVNSRVWKAPLGDYSNTSDNQLTTRALRQDWENIITLNDSWGYKKSDHNWKSPASIVRQIIDVVSKNGNLVINIGPTETGEWDPVSESILLEVGGWLDTCGDSIYGAGESPTARPSWGRCTVKGNTLYLHAFDRPADRKLVVPGLLSDVLRAYMLEDGRELNLTRISEQDLAIELPESVSTEGDESAKPLVIAVHCSGPVEGNPVRLLDSRGDSIQELGVFDSEISGTGLKYDTGKKGRDNLLDWTDESAEAVWSVRTLGAAEFDVCIEYGSGDGEDGGGGTFRVTTGDQTLRAQVQVTGGPYDFQEFYVGRLRFPEAGEYLIRLQAERITGRYLMQPRCLKLQR